MRGAVVIKFEVVRLVVHVQQLGGMLSQKMLFRYFEITSGTIFIPKQRLDNRHPHWHKYLLSPVHCALWGALVVAFQLIA